MRSADRVRRCLLFGADRTHRGHDEADASDPERTSLLLARKRPNARLSGLLISVALANCVLTEYTAAAVLWPLDKGVKIMLDMDQFIADCRRALAEDDSHKSVREVVARAVSNPAGVLKGLGEPKRAEVQKLYHADNLTILNVIWGPRMTVMPHNHQMWAVIGVYTGREDNIFWRRVPGCSDGKVEAAGARTLCEKDAEPLGPNIIHSVTNPFSRLTAAIHVYGGDFFADHLI